MLATGIGRLGLGEPTDVDTDLFTATIGAIGVFGSAVIAGMAVRRGQKRLVVLPLVGLLGLVLAARYADDLHWRLSRDEFEAVLNGRDVPCPSEGDCRLGWWKSYGEERIESIVTFGGMVAIVWRDDSRLAIVPLVAIPLLSVWTLQWLWRATGWATSGDTSFASLHARPGCP